MDSLGYPVTNTMPYPALPQMRQHLYKSRLRDFAPCKGEIPRVQIKDLCEGCISLSNAEGLQKNCTKRFAPLTFI